MAELPLSYRSLRNLAVLLSLTVTFGCQESLALRDTYFMPGGASAARHHGEALHTVRYRRALQVARQSCAKATPFGTEPPYGPDHAATAARQTALAGLCADMAVPATSVTGGTENAYRRWVEDRTRKLPEASATAAGAAGGS